MTNPFLRRIEKRGDSGHGTVSERRLAKKIGANLTPASGAIKSFKGDMKKQVAGQKQLIESKSTKTMLMSVDYRWVNKIATEALTTNSVPLLTLSFVTDEGKARPHGDLMCMPMWYYQELMEKLGNGVS